jgi:hypothetical protein
MRDFDEEWTPEEREALRELAGARVSFSGHEERTLRALQREGLVRRERAWRTILQYTGVAAAVALAFFLGVEFQKSRPGAGQMTSIPRVTEPVPTRVTYHLDLDDPLADSFSEADAHPKVRMAKALAMHEEP